MLIGLIGCKRTGKDTFVDYLVENYNYKKYSFAYKLKLIIFNDEQLYIKDGKKHQENYVGTDLFKN